MKFILCFLLLFSSMLTMSLGLFLILGALYFPPDVTHLNVLFMGKTNLICGFIGLVSAAAYLSWYKI